MFKGGNIFRIGQSVFPLLAALAASALLSAISCGEELHSNNTDKGGRRSENSGFSENPVAQNARADGGRPVIVKVQGSLQNPVWSPDGSSILFSLFTKGYNEGPADLFITNLKSRSLKPLVSNETDDVNSPGASWNSATGKIAFSSSREPHDEIYIIDEQGSRGEEVRVTSREGEMAYEPTLSPDGNWVVFETHPLDIENQGVITRFNLSGGEYKNLTASSEDCRQPNWSPGGDSIIYQNLKENQWDIWIMDSDGASHRKLTFGAGDKTDASFSPDGRWVVYSSDEGTLEYAGLFIISVDGGLPHRVTHYNGYDGAPSWSPDGKKIVFESYPGHPDGSSGTTLWIIDVPPLESGAVKRPKVFVGDKK